MASSGSHADLEKAEQSQMEMIRRIVTPGGHPVDYSQTPFPPPAHRTFGNPAPLGLVSFGLGFFISSLFTLHARGVTTPNVVVPVLILYGGIFQSLVGMWEMATGNTFGAVVFSSYGAFNLTYGAMYLPAFGVISAYTLPDGTLSPEFYQAIGIYDLAWFAVTCLFLLGSFRTTAAVVATLLFTALAFLFLGLNALTASDPCRLAGGAFGLVAALSAWWGAMAGFWSRDTTFGVIRVQAVGLARRD